MNDGNLKPCEYQLSQEEAKKGGIASGAARRRKRDMREWAEILGQTLMTMKTPAEKAMAPHSSTLAWQIPSTEEPGRLQSMGSLRVGHD